MKKRVIHISIIIIFLLFLLALSFLDGKKIIPIQKSGINDNGHCVKTTMPLLTEKDISCSQQIDSIYYHGDLQIIYFTSEEGFGYLNNGTNIIDGTVKAFWIGLENGGSAGEMSTKSADGINSNFQYQLKNNNIYIQTVEEI